METADAITLVQRRGLDEKLIREKTVAVDYAFQRSVGKPPEVGSYSHQHTAAPTVSALLISSAFVLLTPFLDMGLGPG